MLGPKHDLHAAALHFLEARQLVGKDAISASNVFLEPTREGKIACVADLNCQVFIDDLPEVLSSPGLPAGLRAILFDPEGTFNGDAFETFRDWAGTAALLGSRSENVVEGVSCRCGPPGTSGWTRSEGLRAAGRARTIACIAWISLTAKRRAQELLCHPAMIATGWRQNGVSVSRRGLRDVPKPPACGVVNAALYSFIRGRKLANGEVSADHVTAALDFVCRLNGLPREPAILSPGSEACFTLGSISPQSSGALSASRLWTPLPCGRRATFHHQASRPGVGQRA